MEDEPAAEFFAAAGSLQPANPQKYSDPYVQPSATMQGLVDVSTHQAANAPSQHASKHTLLTIPGEIRNRIYDMLFRFNEPIEIVAVLKCDEYYELTELWFAPCSLPGINLLLVCRSIHDEAVSVLYCSNVFIAFNTKVVEKWMESIGHYLSLLRRLQIDITSELDVEGSELSIDILPVLRSGLLHAAPHLQVLFSVTPEEYMVEMTGLLEQFEERASHVSQALQALRDPNRLNPQLRILLRCFRSLSSVLVRRDGNLDFRFQTRSVWPEHDIQSCRDWPYVAFEQAAAGRFERSIQNVIRPDAKRILTHCCVSYRIISYILAGEDEVVFDLANKHASRSLLALMHTAQCSRHRIQNLLLQYPIIVLLTAEKSMTTPETFKPLQDWIFGMMAFLSWASNLTIHLQIKTGGEDTEDSCLINTTELLSVTQSLCSDVQIAICTGEHQSCMSLSDLRKRFLVHLADLRTHVPDVIYMSLPAAYMNEHGRLIHAEYTTEDGIPETINSSTCSLTTFLAHKGDLVGGEKDWYVEMHPYVERNLLAPLREAGDALSSTWELVYGKDPGAGWGDYN